MQMQEMRRPTTLSQMTTFLQQATTVLHQTILKQRQMVAVLMLNQPNRVLIARPLKELCSHVTHFRVPSITLIARCVSALALGIFKGHFSDHVFLTSTNNLILHSLEGRVIKENVTSMQKVYPFLLESALVYQLNNKDDVNTDKVDAHPHVDNHLSGNVFTRDPDFSPYKEISSQTIREFFNNFYGVKLTNKETGNTISDLFASRRLARE